MSEVAGVSLPPIHPIDRRSLSDLVADHIRELVFTGVLRSGDRVSTDAIATSLGVSTLPVREALKVLGRDGLLDLRPRRGTYVGAFDERFLREHFEFVGMVQASAAVGTLLAADDDTIGELAELAERATATSDATVVHDAVMESLVVIDRVGGSPAQRAVRDALGRVLPTGFFQNLPGAADCGRRGLQQILAALRSGDEALVRAASVTIQQERCEVVVAHLVENGVFKQ